MKKIKTTGLIFFWVLLLVWVASFIFARGTMLPALVSGAMFGVSMLNAIVVFLKPTYDGALQMLGFTEDGTPRWRFVLNGDPDEWPNLKEVILKVEDKTNG